MIEDRIRSGGTGNCWKGMRRCKYLETLGRLRGQSLTLSTQWWSQSVNIDSETRDMGSERRTEMVRCLKYLELCHWTNKTLSNRWKPFRLFSINCEQMVGRTLWLFKLPTEPKMFCGKMGRGGAEPRCLYYDDMRQKNISWARHTKTGRTNEHCDSLSSWRSQKWKEAAMSLGAFIMMTDSGRCYICVCDGKIHHHTIVGIVVQRPSHLRLCDRRS